MRPFVVLKSEGYNTVQCGSRDFTRVESEDGFSLKILGV